MARGVRVGSKADVVKNLRALLRVTRKRSSEASYRDCKWSQQILSQYRERQHETDRDKIKAFRSEASDLFMLLSSVQERKHLWDLDEGKDRKLTPEEVVQRSARRVGLHVPESYADSEQDREKEKDEKLKRQKDAAAKYLAAKKLAEAKRAQAERDAEQ